MRRTKGRSKSDQHHRENKILEVLQPILAKDYTRETISLKWYCWEFQSRPRNEPKTNDRIQGYYMEQEFCMTRLDWV